MSSTKFAPIDYDPFADEAPVAEPAAVGPIPKMAPVDYDPFAEPVAPKRKVGAWEAYKRASNAVVPSLVKQGSFLVGLPAAALLDAFTGGYENVDAVGRYVDAKQREENALAINPETEEVSLPGKIAGAVPNLLVDIAAMAATGGESKVAQTLIQPSIEQTTRQAVGAGLNRAFASGATGSVVPATRADVETQKRIIDAGGTQAEAAIGGANTFAASTLANVVPAGAAGGATSRFAQGAASNVAADRVQRQAENAGLPDRLGLDSAAPELSDDLVSALLGGGIGTVLGDRRPAPAPLRPNVDIADLSDPEFIAAVEQIRQATEAAKPAPAPLPPKPPLPMTPERQAALEAMVRSPNAIEADMARLLLQRAPDAAPFPAEDLTLAPVAASPALDRSGVEVGGFSGPAVIDRFAPEAPVAAPVPLPSPKPRVRMGADGNWEMVPAEAPAAAPVPPTLVSARADPADIPNAPEVGELPEPDRLNPGATGDGLAPDKLATKDSGFTGPNGRKIRSLAWRPAEDDLTVWIAANGGITPALAKELGIDPAAYRGKANILKPVVLNGRIVSPDGMSAQQVYERMVSDGWIQPNDNPDAPDTMGSQDTNDMVADALRGEKIYAPRPERMAKVIADKEQSDRDQDELLAREIGMTVPEMVDAGDRQAEVDANRARVAELADLAATERLADESDEAFADRIHPQEIADASPEPAPAPAAVEPAAQAEPVVRPQPDARAGTENSDGPDSRQEPAQASLIEPREPDPSPRDSTSTKNAVRDAEREARGEEPILPPELKTHEETLSEARAAVSGDPSLADRTVAKLANAGVEGITLADESVLTVHKLQLTKARNDAAARATDPDAPADARAQGKADWDAIEAKLNEVDQATSASGTEWGRFGAWRQRQLREDYTFEAMERRERVSRGRPLTADESATIKRQADAIADLSRQLDEAKAASEVDTSKETYEALIRDMQAAIGAPVGGKKRPILEALKASADEARAALAAMDDVSDLPGPRGQKGAAINPIALVHLTKIGAYHVANGAVKLSDWIARMKADLGARFKRYEPALPDVHKLALAAHAAAAKTGKTVESPADVVKALDPEKLTHRDVYNLARAHVLAGVKGEKAVMAAVHADLVGKIPGITERDVRRLFSDYGKAKFPSKDADKKELREIRALVQLQESIDRLQQGLSALKSGQQRDKATQAIRERRRYLNDLLKAAEAKSGPSPEKLASYQDARATNLRNQIEDLEKQIKTGERPGPRAPSPEPTPDVQRLIDQRDALKAELKAIDDAANPPPSPEERYQAARGKALQKRMDELQARVRKGDYSRAVRPPPKPLNDANDRLAYRLAEEKRKFAIKQYEIEQSKRHPIAKVFGVGRAGLNLARAIMTSIDMSAVLRQGGFITLGHPVRGAQNILPMLKAFVSAEYAHKMERDLEGRKNAKLYRRDKLFLAKPNEHANAAEEAFIGRLLDRIPESGGAARRGATKVANLALGPIRGSGRAYITFLNLLRADTYDAMAASLGKSAEVTPEEGKAIANYVNVATGRGKIGSKDKGAEILNEIFFAPRLVASRFNLLAGQPLYAGSNRTRALIAADYARFLTGVAAVVTLAALARDDEDKEKKFVELDPRSSNWMKFRFANTYVDPLAGIGQATIFVAKEASGEKLSNKDKLAPIRPRGRYEDLNLDGDGKLPYKDKPAFGQDDMTDVLVRFARTKLAPVPGAIWNAATGSNVIGQETSAGAEAVNLVTPMSLRNVADIMQDNGVPRGTAIWMAELFGMSVQYRDPDAYKKDKTKD